MNTYVSDQLDITSKTMKLPCLLIENETSQSIHTKILLKKSKSDKADALCLIDYWARLFLISLTKLLDIKVSYVYNILKHFKANKMKFFKKRICAY